MGRSQEDDLTIKRQLPVLESTKQTLPDGTDGRRARLLPISLPGRRCELIARNFSVGVTPGH